MSKDQGVLSENQRAVINEVFSVFNEQIIYVVPRGHRNLPLEVPGADIDIVVLEDDFPTAIKLARELGFQPKYPTKNPQLELILKAIRNPLEALNKTIRSPMEVYTSFSSHKKEKTNLGMNYQSKKLMYNGLQLHLDNHIAYRSPLNDSYVRVDPEVERSMFEGRQLGECCYRPGEEDELAHLICRGVFNYEGEFPEYYITTCNNLFSSINTVKEKDKKFKKILDLVFFQASELVYGLVSEGNYNSIRNNLITFEDY